MDYRKHGKGLFWALAVPTVLATVIFWAILLPFWYGTWKDIDSVINRAQVAAETDDMLGYLKQLSNNMEERGMTHGYTALILKGPDKDLALTYRAINRLIERLEVIQNLDKASTPYQVALDDIRGTLREIPNPAAGFIWVKAFPWDLFILIMWIASGLAWYKSDYL